MKIGKRRICCPYEEHTHREKEILCNISWGATRGKCVVGEPRAFSQESKRWQHRCPLRD